VASALALAAGCSGVSESGASSRGTSTGSGTYSPGGSSTGSVAVTGAGATTGAGVSTGGTGGEPQPGTAGTNGGIRPGTLTAGTWDDNLNFDYYLQYLTRIEGQQIAGLTVVPRTNRLQILVTDGMGAPLGNALVTVSNAAGQQLLRAPTRSDGKLFFFPGAANANAGDALYVTAALGIAQATGAATVGDATLTIPLAAATASLPRTLDLALVIDTTGSMGDELGYLQVEVSAIATQIGQQFPGVAERLALILYRDDGDAYVVRSFDFTTSLSTFQSEIAAQSADGGGDWPESPDKALAQLPQLAWSPDTSARVAFWIADAPHHSGRAPAMIADFQAAQAAGIHLYPIAASGTDDLLEYTMRTGAELTGGRYLFLTNDSGVGNDHKEPTIPCYQVTSLDKAMLRMIAMELTGMEIEPAASDVIRTSGDPQDGHCVLSNGQQVLPL
jgi:hypothetical protein